MRLKQIFCFVGSFAFLFISSVEASTDKNCPLFFKKAKLCGKIEWTVPPKNVEMPTDKDAAELIFDLFSENSHDDLSTRDYQIEVRPFMPSMGHGTLPTFVSVDPEVNSPSRIRFRVKRILFSMPGAWEIRIKLKKVNQPIDQIKIPYTL